MKLRQNLILAQQALNYVLDQEILSPQSVWTKANFDRPSYKWAYSDLADDLLNKIRLKLKDIKAEDEDKIGNAMSEVINTIRQVARHYVNFDTDEITFYKTAHKACCFLFSYPASVVSEYNDDREKLVQLLTDQGVKAKRGGCEIQTAIAYQYLISKSAADINLEILILKNQDHWFLVIGRDPNTDLKNSKSWNEATVVCDPWAYMIYPANKISRQMQFLIDSQAIWPYPGTKSQAIEFIKVHDNASLQCKNTPSVKKMQ